MRVLLIYPCYDQERQFGKFKELARNCMPLGLATIGAVLRNEGHEVSAIDTSVSYKTEKELAAEVKFRNPEVIGISVITQLIDAAHDKVRICREACPNAKIIVGGPHLTHYPLDAFKHFPGIDYAVYGEGEYTMKELVGAIEKKNDIKTVKGVIYQENGEVKQTPMRPEIQDLDELPFPQRDLFEVVKYRPSMTRFKQLPSTSLYTSRGCPYRCAFCNQTFSKKIRIQSAKRTYEEMLECYSKWGIRDFEFFDDSMGNHKKKLYELCDLLKQSKVKFTWSCQIRTNQVSDEIIKMMKDAGCWNIRFGIESGVQRILDYITKDQTNEQTEMAVRLCDKYGIIAYGGFIIGLPTETKEETQETIDFAKKIPLDHANFAIFEPRPGTRLFELAKEEGFQVDDLAYSSIWAGISGNLPVYAPKGREPKELAEAQKRAFREFYLRPSLFLRHIRKIRTWQDLKTSVQGLKVLVSM
ncbi:MAG TPA: radical SAM protein [Candidatus Nanoarchaeia archaeon]|nr:radical SAM protein [Candidatus Nanoarchaeia archaeon]